MARDTHIAIVGGGIAGLTAALALRRSGVTVTVLEQAEALEELGAGLQVSPNAWRVLDALDLGSKLAAASVMPEAVRIRSARYGATLARMPLGRTAEARWGAPYRIIHRADLQTILADAVVGSGATLRLASRISDLRHDPTQVEITLDSEDRLTVDAVVGADGLWSRVRREAIDATPPRLSGKVAWRTTVPANALPFELDIEETGLWLGRDTHLVHYGVRGGEEVNIIAVVTSDWQAPGWSAPGEPAEIAAAFADWPGAARSLVEAPRSWRRWALADRPPDRRWGDGPLTLVGDAAHPMLPFLAQGAAMGIEDGLILAKSLTGADGVAAAFRRYEAQRMPRTARVQRAARTNGDIYHLGGLAARGRDLALSLMGPDRLLSRWDWLYGWRPG